MTKSDDQSTRDRILAAAVQELADVGWTGSRTRSISERAGVNNALIHYHFSSMEDLLLEAVSSTFARMAEQAADSLTADTVALGIDGMLEMLENIDPRDPLWRVVIEAIMQTPRIPRLGEWTKDLLEGYRSAMQGRLDAAVEAGEWPAATDTEGVALGLMALLDGLGLYAHLNPDYDIRRAGLSIINLLTNSETASATSAGSATSAQQERQQGETA